MHHELIHVILLYAKGMIPIKGTKNVLVKYRNDLNSVPFRKFNRREFNVFFAIVSRMRDKGLSEVKFSYKYLMQLSGVNYHRKLSRFTHDLETTSQKLQHLSIYRNTAKEYVNWILFPTFRIDKVNHIVEVAINPKLYGVLNNLVNWTRFSLAQFTKLRSSYSKTMFRLIKQYRTTGKLKLPNKKFRTLLCVPKSYSNNEILRRIIKPIEIELTPLIKGLCITRQRGGRGGKILGYYISFHPESPKHDDFSKGWFGNENQMLNNLKMNDYIRPEWKKESKRRVEEDYGITQEKDSKKPVEMDYDITMPHDNKEIKKEPDDAFKRLLKSSKAELEFYLDMAKQGSQTVHFSKKQIKILKKTIKNKK